MVLAVQHSEVCHLLRASLSVDDGHPLLTEKIGPKNMPYLWNCKVLGKLLLLTYRKSHTGFLLVLNLVTLNHVVAVILHYAPNLVPLGANYITVIEVWPTKKCRQKNLLFANVWLVMIFSEITENNCIALKIEKSHCATLHSHVSNSWVLAFL